MYSTSRELRFWVMTYLLLLRFFFLLSFFLVTCYLCLLSSILIISSDLSLQMFLCKPKPPIPYLLHSILSKVPDLIVKKALLLFTMYFSSYLLFIVVTIQSDYYSQLLITSAKHPIIRFPSSCNGTKLL